MLLPELYKVHIVIADFYKVHLTAGTARAMSLIFIKFNRNFIPGPAGDALDGFTRAESGGLGRGDGAEAIARAEGEAAEGQGAWGEEGGLHLLWLRLIY